MNNPSRFNCSPTDVALYGQQQAMAANVGRLKSMDAKRRQARLLVRSLVKRAGAK